MEDFINIRQLFCACIVAILFAILCSFMRLQGLIVLFFSLLLLFLLILPLTFSIKSTTVLSLILSLVIVAVNIVYFNFAYKPALKYSNTEISAYGTVIDVSDKYATVVIKETVDGKTVNIKSNLYFENDIDFVPSAEIKFDALFFDNSDRRYAQYGIHSSALVSEYETIKPVNEKSLYYIYYVFRQRIKNIITFENEALTAFISGVLLGQTEDIDGILINKLRGVGLSHVISVSGMHLMFAVLFIDKFLAFIGLHYKRRAFISIFAAFTFAFLSGFAISCIRSLIMLIIYFVAQIKDEFHDGLTSLAFSAFLILFLFPYNLYNVSFILSVLATYGMMIITPLVESVLPFKPRKKIFLLTSFLYAIRTCIAVSIAANIACIPIFLVLFKQVSIISPIVNLVLTIPIQIIFNLSFATLVLFFIPVFKSIIAPVLVATYNFVVKVVSFCYNLNYADITDGSEFFYFVFAILLILILGIYLFKQYKSKIKIYPFLVGYVILCLSLFVFNIYITHGKIMVKFVDVGQGNCSFASSSGRAVIFDCGGEYSSEIFNELKKSNVKRIELLALTHADYDHVSFVENILDTYQVDRLVYPDFADKEDMAEIIALASKRQIQLEEITSDTNFQVLDGAVVSVMSEKAHDSKITNNTSALYKFTYGETSVCFTGDMSLHQEYVYLNYGGKLDCDILLVPHHGSASSSYNKILELYSPEFSVISASSDNLFGFPDERIVKRLEGFSEVINIAKSGSVCFELNKNGYKRVLK